MSRQPTKSQKAAAAAGKPRAGAGNGVAADSGQLLRWYRDMLLIRRFEGRAGQMYGMGLIGGFCHLYIGQEAVVVGIQACLTGQDSVVTGYRDHGHMLAAGMGARGVMAELTGRAGGYSRGKGGSMHMFSREKNFFGGHGIVAAQVPIGVGLGFSHRYKGGDSVSVVYFGDGAANQGQVYESLNLAALWELPVLFVIENNKYGMGTAVSRAAAGAGLHARGAGFGIPGSMVDGMDVRTVYAAASEAVAQARLGKPVILEMETYRYRGHSMSDPAKYRTREEVDRMRRDRDPIERLRHVLESEGHADAAALKAIDAEIRAVVADAAQFAEDSPEPDPAELHTDVLLEA